MPLQPRPEISSLSPVFHGSPDIAELKLRGINPDDIVDFSVCSNPFMPPPNLKGIIDDNSISRHPDSETAELRRLLAEKNGVGTENLLAGNGSTEIIRLIALCYFGAGDKVIILEPTFGEYAIACRIAGAEVIRQRAGKECRFIHRIEDLIPLAKKARAKGIFICNPNNPTGFYFTQKEIETLLEACPDTLLVLDEAYIAFVKNSWQAAKLIKRGNLIIVRSMTKDYSLAGLRLGYAISNAEVINILRRAHQPWNVNTIAQIAGIITMKDESLLASSLTQTREAADYLRKALEGLGYSPLPSATHFFLMEVGNAAAFRNTLLNKGLIVRDCASFGLPEYVRIASRTLPECARLVKAIGEIKKEL